MSMISAAADDPPFTAWESLRNVFASPKPGHHGKLAAKFCRRFQLPSMSAWCFIAIILLPHPLLCSRKMPFPAFCCSGLAAAQLRDMSCHASLAVKQRLKKKKKKKTLLIILLPHSLVPSRIWQMTQAWTCPHEPMLAEWTS